MRFGVLGTGMVGSAISSRLASLGHEVRMGSRSAGNEKAVAWAAGAGEGASEGSFADAAEFGEIIFNCTAGAGALDALAAAGEENLAGKLVIDVSNPLDFTQTPPGLLVTNTDSLGEQIQRALPRARVVKALNTMNCDVMVEPGSVPGDHVAFVCGNDPDAKTEAKGVLGQFGWPAERVLDLGEISAARGTEGYLPLWLRMMGPLGTSHFNIAPALRSE
jgi:8-hydroxy-5-deazaflavin:NADPH oxidoreductase